MISRDRPPATAFSPSGFIPSSAIIGYAKDVEGIAEAGEMNRTIRMVRAIDEEYLTSKHKPPEEGK